MFMQCKVLQKGLGRGAASPREVDEGVHIVAIEIEEASMIAEIEVASRRVRARRSVRQGGAGTVEIRITWVETVRSHRDAGIVVRRATLPRTVPNLRGREALQGEEGQRKREVEVPVGGRGR